MNVELSKADLALLANALNEVLHGLGLDEFDTRLGVGREEAKVLHERLSRLCDEAK